MGDVGAVDRHQGLYSMPFEGDLHSHTLMVFPSLASVYSEEDLNASQEEVINIANTIARFEPVHLYTREEQMVKAESMAGTNVHVKAARVDQLWARDSAPTYVYDKQGSRTAVNFNFNYWGKKLPSTGDEDLVAQVVKQESQPTVRSRLTTEGGAIEHDGQGTFLATESSLINDNRNPGMSKAEIEGELRAMLGVSSFIWIPGVKGHDITDYHIDILARFVRPGVVVLSKPASSAPDFVVNAYEEAKRVLSNSRDARGRALTVHTCREPDTSLLGPPDESNEVVASYVNYHLVNGAVILPRYGQQEPDNEALELFKLLFPEREVVQVYLNMLPRSGGGIHCATQQVIAPHLSQQR